MEGPHPGLTTDDAPPVVEATFAPGMVIAGRYRIESRLGAGGGGTVWRCTDEKLHGSVALKIVSSEGDLERWRREVAMARRIAHRNVCRVHDLGEADGMRFVTMELVEGVGLRTKIRPGVTVEQARDLFRQVVAGVAAIHAAGVVHRDLKPENIVVATDGRAVIVDFGLAREPRAPGDSERTALTVGPRAATPRADRQPPANVTNPGMIVGTPRYMSPEQAAGDTVDARTDVWALGLIGHELVTGVLPGHDEDGGRRIDAAAAAKWPRGIPVLRRCLALVPEQRYADARELEAALAGTVRRRWPMRTVLATAAAGALVGGLFALRAVIAGDDTTVPTPTPPIPDKPPGPRPVFKITQLTTTAPKDWPDETPMSVAIDPAATRFAYTTGGAKLYVRDFATNTTTEWPAPSIDKPRPDPTKPPRKDTILSMLWAVGWFSDRSLAVFGTTTAGEWQLYRVREDGSYSLLHSRSQRFSVAVSAVKDLVVIGVDNDAIYAMSTTEPIELEQITTIGRGERVLGLAFAPDAPRFAVARMAADAKDEMVIQVMSLAGGDITPVWQGKVGNVIDALLVWLDDDRLAFSHQDPVTGETAISVHDVRTRATIRDRRMEPTQGYVGIGSAAQGTLLMLTGAAAQSVQIGDGNAGKLQLLHDRDQQAGQLAGWTTDGRVVFALGEPGTEQIVSGTLSQGIEPWPGTTAGVEVPDTMVGDSVIAHRTDPNTKEIVIERIGPGGEKKELARTTDASQSTYVRCAGDRVAPCVLEEVVGDQVSWLELDPDTGGKGVRVHKRKARAPHGRSVALSPDGRMLAIVDGSNDVSLIERGSDAVRTFEVGDGVVLQSVAFAPDGELWATSIGHRGRLFGLMSFTRYSSGKLSDSASVEGRSTMRWFWRPTPSPDGQRVALTVRELRLDLARVDGL